MVVRQMPMGSYKAILYPNIRILLRKGDLYERVLYEDRGMRFAVDMHNLALVVYEVLQAQRRSNHLTRCTEVVEFASRQWQNGNLQRGNLIIRL